MKKKLAITACIACAMSLSSYAMTLTLTEAKFMALSKSYDAQINMNDSKVLNTQRLDLMKEILPQLSFNSTIYPNATPNATTGTTTNVSNTLTVTQPIFSPSIFLAVKGAMDAKDLSFNDLNQKQKAVVLGVESQFIDILKAQNQVLVLEKKLEVNKADLNRANALLAMKMIVKTDMLDIKYQQTATQTDLLSAQNDLHDAISALKSTLRISATEPLTLVSVPGEVKDIKKRDIEADVAYANTHASEILYMHDNFVYNSSISMGAGLNSILPTVSLMGSYSAGGSNLPDSFQQKWGWTYGIQVSMPLFAWGQNLHAYQNAKRNVDSDKMGTQRDIDNYLLSVRTQYNAVVKYQEMQNALEVQYESAKENSYAQKERFNAGLITSTDYMTAENNMYQSEINMKNNKLDLYYNYDKYLSMIEG